MASEFLREKAAIAAMNGLLLVRDFNGSDLLAKKAVEMADALMAELDKKKDLTDPVTFPHVHEVPVEVTK